MCGITGYIGKQKALPILIKGLSSLEYRGYDSAGVAYLYKDKIKTIKCVGRVDKLKELLDMDTSTNIGIGHTRWATHGGVTKNNSHPHTKGKVTIVHNGIIENYYPLKKKLLSLGYEFISETDSEILCGLIDYYYRDNDILTVLEKITKEVTGSYAVGIILSDNPEYLYTIRKDSPLIIGVGKDENFIASDVPAIVEYTNKYIILDDYDIAKIGKNSIEIFNNGIKIQKKINKFSGSSDEISKNGFDHYMLKEINEEPILIRKNLHTSLDDIPSIKKYKNIYIVGCGSAYHAGLVGKYLIEEYSDKMVNVEIASEFRYKKLFLTKNDLVILISQSGETADTLASLKIAKEMNATTLGLVNVQGSSLAREADIVVYTNALVEVAVATTKAYLMQVYMFGLIAIKSSNLSYKEIYPYYKRLANQIDCLLNYEDYEEIAEMINKHNDIFFLGRGIDYAVSMEGSLKLKEISYIHSEAYPAGELKHGTIALIEKGTPVISVITDNKIKDKTISNIKEIIARGAKSIIVCSAELDIPKDYYDKIIRVPKNIDSLRPILAVIPLQLIAYYTAKLNKLDIDKPRNLAKSVTVE